MKFTILVDPSFDIMYFHYITYMAMPVHQNPRPGGNEIYNFGRPLLGHYSYTISSYGPCPGVEKKIF